MISGECQQCPLNCLVCSGSTCDICFDGYRPNTNGSCVMKCNISCLTCVDGQPNYCTSCFRGAVYTATNGTWGNCSVNLTCNSHNNCTSCASGFNYMLVINPSTNTSRCEPCPFIEKCRQCSQVDSYRCSLCLRGYFTNSSGFCQMCNSSCLHCSSASICTECKANYTIMAGYTSSTCIPCASPCLTCKGSPHMCLKCISGFTKKGWSCRNDTGFTFSFTINDLLTNVMGNIGPIMQGCLQALGSTNAQDLIFERIYTGSTIVTGSGQVQTGNVTQAAQAFSNTISAGIPGTSYSASSVSVQYLGQSTSNE